MQTRTQTQGEGGAPIGLRSSAATVGMALPPAASVMQALADAPAFRAARLSVDAERSVHRQYQVGAHEWTATAYAARRNLANPTFQITEEWEVGIERAVRLPGKAAVYDAAGRALVDQAQASLHKVWREQARLLLERYGAWLRDREAARVWGAQTQLLQRQLDVVTRRRKLGDAARIEQQQASAALTVAEAQAQAAADRLVTARESLDRQFPGLDLIAVAAAPLPAALPIHDAGFGSDAWSRTPEVTLARSLSGVAQTQLRLDLAERHADPTVGVRVGRQGNGNESYAGLTLTVPFGGAYREAGAAASASRAAAAAQSQADAERLAQVELNQRAREASTAYESWKRNADAAAQLGTVADGMARGYQLGEGNLVDVLMARRLANEQQLGASIGLVDAWMTRSRFVLEEGELWDRP